MKSQLKNGIMDLESAICLADQVKIFNPIEHGLSDWEEL